MVSFSLRDEVDVRVWSDLRVGDLELSLASGENSSSGNGIRIVLS